MLTSGTETRQEKISIVCLTKQKKQEIQRNIENMEKEINK